MSKEQSVSLVCTMLFGAALSSIVGGTVADALVNSQCQEVVKAETQLSKAMSEGGDDDQEDAMKQAAHAYRSLHTSRIFIAELGLILAAVTVIVLYVFIPRPVYGGETVFGYTTGTTSFILFGVFGFLYAIVANFDEQAADLPITGDIIPADDLGLAYGVLNMIQSLFATMSVCLVGWLCDFEFGFVNIPNHANTSDWSTAVRVNNSVALSHALLATCLFSYLASFVCYRIMRCTLADDVRFSNKYMKSV